MTEYEHNYTTFGLVYLVFQHKISKERHETHNCCLQPPLLALYMRKQKCLLGLTEVSSYNLYSQTIFQPKKLLGYIIA